MTKTIIALAASLAAFTAMPAQAQANNGGVATVSYADLQLDHSAGVAKLDRRIQSAVDAVCGELEGRPTFDASVRQCRSETLAAVKSSRDLAIANYGDRRMAANSKVIRFVAR